MYCSNAWLRKRPKPSRHPPLQGIVGSCGERIRTHFLELSDVIAGTEGAVTRALKHQDTSSYVILHLRQNLRKAAPHGFVDGVQPGRIFECEPSNAPIDCQMQHLHNSMLGSVLRRDLERRTISAFDYLEMTADGTDRPGFRDRRRSCFWGTLATH